MNNEKLNQIIDKAYENYRDKSKLSQIPTDLTKEEFVKLCKNDITFSVYWGLKIEERELSFNRRYRLGDYQPYNIEGKVEYEKGLDYITQEQFETFHNKEMDKLNIPTKLITITYNDIKTEIYE